MTNPLVSVVIPTYNHGHFLKKALQSVLAQTYVNWEVIVVDNHSTDNTDTILSALRHPKIRVLKIHNNGVIAASRNCGIRSATGDWIAFLDSDDNWYPEKLATLTDAVAVDCEADVIANDEMMVDIRTDQRQVLRHGPYETDFYRILLTKGNRLSPSATMVRRSFLARTGVMFDESPEFATVEDYDFWLHLARAGARFRFVSDVLGEFVIHASNNSASMLRQMSNGEAVLRRHVFTLQQFEPKPDRLWAEVATRLKVARARHLWQSGAMIRAVGVTVCMLTRAPRQSFAYLWGRVRARLSRA